MPRIQKYLNAYQTKIEQLEACCQDLASQNITSYREKALIQQFQFIIEMLKLSEITKHLQKLPVDVATQQEIEFILYKTKVIEDLLNCWEINRLTLRAEKFYSTIFDDTMFWQHTLPNNLKATIGTLMLVALEVCLALFVSPLCLLSLSIAIPAATSMYVMANTGDINEQVRREVDINNAKAEITEAVDNLNKELHTINNAQQKFTLLFKMPPPQHSETTNSSLEQQSVQQALKLVN